MIQKFCSIIDRLTMFFGSVSDWLCLGLVALTAQQVVARYFFNSSSVALQELQWHLFGLVILLSMAQTFKTDQHVRVDIIFGRLTLKWRAAIDLLGILLLLLPICTLLVYYGWNYAAAALTYTNLNSADHYSKAYFAVDGAAYRFFASVEGYLRETLLRGEVSANPGGLEGRWLIKASIPFGSLLLLLQSLSEAGKRLRVLLGQGANIER